MSSSKECPRRSDYSFYDSDESSEPSFFNLVQDAPRGADVSSFSFADEGSNMTNKKSLAVEKYIVRGSDMPHLKLLAEEAENATTTLDALKTFRGRLRFKGKKNLLYNMQSRNKNIPGASVVLKDKQNIGHKQDDNWPSLTCMQNKYAENDKILNRPTTFPLLDTRGGGVDNNFYLRSPFPRCVCSKGVHRAPRVTGPQSESISFQMSDRLHHGRDLQTKSCRQKGSRPLAVIENAFKIGDLIHNPEEPYSNSMIKEQNSNVRGIHEGRRLASRLNIDLQRTAFGLKEEKPPVGLPAIHKSLQVNYSRYSRIARDDVHCGSVHGCIPNSNSAKSPRTTPPHLQTLEK